MKTTSFAVKASLIATMIISGQAFAQNLPDEVNHPQYLRIYQNLETVLNQKTIEFDKLNEQKITLEKTIAQMEKDQVDIPARNAELERIIENKRQEVSRLNSEIQGLEGVLGKIIEDLRRLDNMIAQLQRDIGEESNRSQQIQQRRNQVAHDVAQINARLQREVREEQQSEQVLSRLTNEMNNAAQKRQEEERERNQLIRNVDRFKVEIVTSRNAVNTNNAQLATKRPALSEAQAKLPGVKADLATAEAKIGQIDVTLTPKRTQLNALKAELARLSPDVARLTAENKTLSQKIESNQAKINASNVQGQIARRDALESEIASVKTQVQSNVAAVIALQEEMKPVNGQINDLMVKLREAQRNRNMPEVARLKAEIDNLSDSISGKRMEVARLNKENERLNISIAPKQAQINTLNTAIQNANAQNAALEAEIVAARNKIVENDKRISEIAQSNAGLGQQIAALETEVNALQAEREPLAVKAANLKQREGKISSEINTLTADIGRLENETQKLNAHIAEMEKTITEFPQTLRRLENHIRQLGEKIAQNRSEIDREQRLLARIRQDRQTVEMEMNRSQQVLNQVNADLENSERLIGALRNKLNEENRTREALTRYNQDSIRKFDALKLAKVDAEKEIAAASEEVGINDQDIATIAQELPKLRSDLIVVSPKVAAALASKNTAQKNVNDANTQYQNRLSLYQNYLSEAQQKGAQKAAIGTTDGAKAGAIDAKTKANKLASENASVEGKWEAIRRAYVRGEIAGYRAGFDIGLASTPDAVKGEEDGRIAGLRRAKDHSNLVVKPQLYLEELERRLKEDETSSAKPMVAAMIRQEISMIKAMSSELQETIPDLSQSEINEASRIVSSLDALIAQSDIEIEEILKLRNQLSDARNVYSAPGAGINANNANCSDVYKNVKDFVDACKGSYVIRYQNLYNTSHSEAFNRDYGITFKAQIDSVFANELNRLYPGYLKEASTVGREVGISSGKKEVYQQSFNRSENASYGGALPGEMARVETEAVNLVQEHLNGNAALTLKGSAKISTGSIYGVAPGIEADLKMLIKNVGSQASLGNSIVKVTEISGNISADRREAPLSAVAANSHSDLSVLKLKVNDAATPGSKVIIAGEIVHPGNHYRSSRVESFRIETLLAINPSVTTAPDFDATPDIAGIFGTKKHNIDLVITPKFAGVDQGYEVTLEEVGSSFVQIVASPAKTEVLARGAQKKVRFTYKLLKTSKGKTVTLKMTVKNAGKIVSQQDLQVIPK